MKKKKKLIEEFIAECQEDYVGLWSLVKDVKRSYIVLSMTESQKNIKNILLPLLSNKTIVAGNPDPNSVEFLFKIMEDSPDKIVKYIISEWNNLGRDPDIGEIIWFTKK